MPESAQTRIQRALETLVATPHGESSLIVESGEVYLMFITGGHGRVRMEAVTSDFLSAPLKLSAGRANELRKMGFCRAGRNRNWTRDLEFGIATIPRLAAESEDILRRIYGIDDEPTLQVRHDDANRPENESLVDAMRELARQESLGQRQIMYSELVNATFLVPVETEETRAAAESSGSEPGTGTSLPDDAGETVYDSGADLSEPAATSDLSDTVTSDDLQVHDLMDGHPVFVAFTDWASLRLWNPKGCPYACIHGSELFESLVERDAAALEINPAGVIGGQLFRHEVELLAEAVRNHRRTHMN